MSSPEIPRIPEIEIGLYIYIYSLCVCAGGGGGRGEGWGRRGRSIESSMGKCLVILIYRKLVELYIWNMRKVAV